MEKISVYEAYIAQNGASMTTWLDQENMQAAYDHIAKDGRPFTVWAMGENPPSTTALTIVPALGGVTFHIASYASTDVLYYDAEMKRVPSENGAAGKMTAGEHARAIVKLTDWTPAVDRLASAADLAMAAFASQNPTEAAAIKAAVDAEAAKNEKPAPAPEKATDAKPAKK